MGGVVVVGSLNMDIVAVSPRLPQPGQTLTGTRYFTEPGGKGANQAYAAARLGAKVAMLGRVGSDDHGKRMCANLAGVGCEVTGVRAIDGASGIALIMVSETGQNAIVVVPGANHAYAPIDIDGDDAAFSKARLVLLQLETPMATVIAAAQAAKRRGALVILDPAPALPSLPQELLMCVDILTPNETEASQLIGRAPGALSVDDARDAARALQATGVKSIVIKLGDQGCLLAEGDDALFIPAVRVDAVDATAAGDVFNAALAVACSEGADLADACRFAVRAASVSVTRLGAQRSMPDRAQVEAVR